MKKLLLLALLVLVLVGCGKSSTDYNSYRNEDEKIRFEQIKKVLIDYKLINYNKFTLMYIDNMIITVDFYKVLEKQYSTSNFDKFFQKAVQVLYYSYEPDNFKLAPKRWRKATEKFFLNLYAYDYSYGEAKYEKYLKKEIAEYNVFLFYLSDDEVYENLAKSNFFMFLKVTIYEDAWAYGGYTYKDFKKLTVEDQALVLRRNAAKNIMDNDALDDDTVELLDDFQLSWLRKSKYYMSKKSFRELPNEAPFSAVFEEFRVLFIGE